MIIKGHRREELRDAGERGEEQSWTWVCECGATESAHTKRETLREWSHHLRSVRERRHTAEST